MVILDSRQNEIYASSEDSEDTSVASHHKTLGLRLSNLLQLRVVRKSASADTESESCASFRRGGSRGASSDEWSTTSGGTQSSFFSLSGIFVRRSRKRPYAAASLGGAPVVARVSKHVSFADQEAVVVSTFSIPEECKRDLFYSKKELNIMSSSARRTGEDLAWNKDKKKVVTCLRYCYGLSTKQQDITRDQALAYYLHYEVTEGKTKTKTTVRGLERHILPCIGDYRQQCLQSVLTVQAKMRSKGEPPSSYLNDALARQSRHYSEKAESFALLIGNHDFVIALES